MEFFQREIAIWKILLIYCLTLSIIIVNAAEFCPESCFCDSLEKIYCENAKFDTIPWDLPLTTISVHINNGLLTKLQKHAFKNYPNLEEIIIENCDQLTVIERQAFKNLRNLRTLKIQNNGHLKLISKGSFSHISSKKQLKIHLLNNALEDIEPGSFRQLSLLREFSISSSKCLNLKSGSFAGLSQIDFLNLRNACNIDNFAFKNSTRIYRVNISNSVLTLKKGVFYSIAHSNEIRLENNKISSIDVDAFYGLDTVERLVIVGNKIGNISSHAFTSIVNIGDLIIEENEIRYLHPESLQSTAWRTKFRDNYIECNCENQWIKYIKDTFLLKHNFCGSEESFRTLTNYVPNCSMKAKVLSKSNVATKQLLQGSHLCIMALLILSTKSHF